MIKTRSADNAKQLKELPFGNVDNLVLTGIITTEEVDSKSHIALIFSQWSEEQSNFIASSRFDWFKLVTGNLKHTTKPLAQLIKENMLELIVQMHDILSAFIGEEKAYEAMTDTFKPFPYETVEEFLEHTWKTEAVRKTEKHFRELVEKLFAPYMGSLDHKVKMLIVPNKNGERRRLPRFNKFILAQDSTTALELSDYDKSQISNIAMTDEERAIIKTDGNSSAPKL